ncbi:MAG: Gfo/Idh/MocA family oxidoreductase [Clostridia bacterium]|nr:Gfo/Idh/MocA family oxidoreductase [Clostridia bacterium]
MDKVRIGVLGGYRGSSMINYCKGVDTAEVVAICDKSREVLDAQKGLDEEKCIALYDNFDEFIQHDMDAVVLANYAHEHAPFAIKALKKGKHVFSEVLPAGNMKEAIELIETVEETGLVYAYGENYCYMNGPYEMRRLYREGKIGEFEYGECEYIHNCEPIWHSITYGEKDHWRNNMYSTFYCTHSLGPIIHMTGLRPVSVIGLEGTKNERSLRVGSKRAPFGIEMVTLENGGIIKSIHGDLYKNSVWYSVYGSKGRMETAREDTRSEKHKHLYVNCDEYSGEYGTENITDYYPELADNEFAQKFTHGGSDYYSMDNFVRKIMDDPEADIIDVYEAMDMFLPGYFAYLSILDGNKSKEIPNLRDKAARDEWRNYTGCTDPKTAGDMLWPTCSLGTPDIADEVYGYMKYLWNEESKKTEGTYRTRSFKQGGKYRESGTTGEK